MTDVIVIGGGLAGLAAAAALGGAGYQVSVLEARGFLGGRATSFPVTPSQPDSETIDNCQHILLRCCVNLLDFYARLRVADKIDFSREFTFIEPGGRRSTFAAGVFPAPLHFIESFVRLKFLGWRDKVAIARGFAALRAEHGRRNDLDQITMLDWLREKNQTQRAIDRFWRPVLVSAINEEPAIMAAQHAFQVIWLGFLAGADFYEMGVPAVPLADLYGDEAWSRFDTVHLEERAGVDKILLSDGRVDGVVSRGERFEARHYVAAVPFERLSALAPELELDLTGFSHSPITGIHLWFDRAITDLPHATLLDRTIQWMYNKGEGRHVQLVVSASRSLVDMPRGEIIELALRELAEFFPLVRQAKLEKSHVVKEVRATFSACPGLEARRPRNATRFPNLFLAGDWTKSGWPATMEGAIRSGYLAAEAIAAADGVPQRWLLPDVA